MNVFRIFLRLLRSGLILWLITYWAIFISYTIMNLATGGPTALVAWYRHIARAPFQWNWRVFLAAQMGILAFTLVVLFFGVVARRTLA